MDSVPFLGKHPCLLPAAPSACGGIPFEIMRSSLIYIGLFLFNHAFGQEIAPTVEGFANLAREATWSESWPDAAPAPRTVTARIWNEAIQAALAKHGAVHLPKLDLPYYLDGPIVLRSGQHLSADPDAEIRLKPQSNSCMVRNEHVVGFADQEVPAETAPDTDIRIEGGIWTTLSTNVKGANGNLQGRSSSANSVPGTHGVILLQNVRRVTVKNVTVRRSTAFALHLANIREFTVEGIHLDRHGRDGVHVNGPASEGVIRGVTGDSHDDPVSLCAWDWKNCAPSFGPIRNIVIEQVTGVPLDQRGTDAIRLLPGVKRFSDGRTLDCPIENIVLRDIHDIREFKLYDQPNLELGRDQDYSVEVGTLRNIRFQRLRFSRPGVIKVAANVEGLGVEDVQFSFLPSPSFKLVEIGPMSGTYRPKADDPTTWVEIYSPDRDVTVRGFSLREVQIEGRPQPTADATLVKIADQQLNPDYPASTPRGGRGKARVVDAPR